MTRKHFVAIAAAIKAYKGGKASVDETARAIADVCAQSNPRFNYARFLKACGV